MERINEYRSSTDASDNVPDVANMAKTLQQALGRIQQLEEQLHDKRQARQQVQQQMTHFQQAGQQLEHRVHETGEVLSRITSP